MELPGMCQALYYLLNLNADDDGFINNPQTIRKSLECTKEQLQLLVDRGFLLDFSSGVMVVTHWRLHNDLKKDRYKPTIYQEEFARLTVAANKMYTLSPNCIQEESGVETQTRLEENRIEKMRTDKTSIEPEAEEGQPVSVGESSVGSSVVTDKCDRILSLYNACCPSLEPCTQLSYFTKRRLETMAMPDYKLREAFVKANHTPFLRGEGNNGWKASLDWLCTDDHLNKVLSGAYDPREPPKKPSIFGSGELGEVELREIRKLLAEE